MTPAQFKTHLATFLWKENDTVLLNSLDSLIAMGLNELNRKLDISRRVELLEVAHVGDAIPLPTDFSQLVSVTHSGQACTNLTQAQFNNLTHNTQKNKPLNVFHLRGRNILLPYDYPAENPGLYEITYRTKIPFVIDNDESWMIDEYLDCFTYTVLKHSAPFLREDERVALWTQLSNDTIVSVIDDDKWNIQYAGGPLHVTIPTQVYGDPTLSRIATSGTSYSSN